MSYTERRIVESYFGLLNGLSSSGKIELIERLTKSLNDDARKTDRSFYKSFGAFASEKPAEQIIKEIRLSRKFRKKKAVF